MAVALSALQALTGAVGMALLALGCAALLMIGSNPYWPQGCPEWVFEARDAVNEALRGRGW